MPDNSYLLRFDDICPTMNWSVWEEIERTMNHHGVRPILAVVPDNRDPNLVVDLAAPDFWERVRRWQAMGYCIAIHGYQHVYVNRNKGMMRLTPNSEFAGLPYEEQLDKMRKGLAIFAENGVTADAFVAPSHSFDPVTLKVLREVGLKVISDGLWPWPHEEAGIFWIPQQLWRFGPKSSGVWTVCCHHNRWTRRTLDRFIKDLGAYASRMTDVQAITQAYAGRPLTVSDRLSCWTNLVWNHRILPILSKVRGRLYRRRPQA
jgi:peptidoglycan/xylan/chitin deacetylase (PgdA/CDA1 family)